MIILEGADHVGKTTLAKTLLAHPYLQQGGYIFAPLSRLPDGFHRFWGYVEHARRRTVADRFHMSEVVYPWARGDDETPLTPERYRRVDATLRLRPAFTVVISCESQVLRRRLERASKDEMYGGDLILKVNSAFEQIGMHRQFTYHVGANRHVFYDQMDVDAHLRMTSDDPFPTEKDAANIIEAYIRRTDQWEVDHRINVSARPELSGV